MNDLMKETVTGYSTVTTKNSNIQLKDGKVSYALLPVWILNTKYKDKIYTFAMNGQTGKFIGELPISWKRFWAYFGVFSVIFSIICCAIAWWLM